MEKSFWQAIKQQDFAVPEGFAVVDLVPDLLAALAPPDGDLRELGYEVLGTWVERGQLTPEQLRTLIAQLRQNLKAGLGERGTDSVFLRSYSTLILTEVVAYDWNARFLTGAELAALVDTALEYLAAEQDLRGYVPGKGWAHTVAHTGDLVRCLGKHPGVDAAALERLLAGLAAKVTAETDYQYLAMEEDRLARAAVWILERNLLAAEQVRAWLQSIAGARPWRKLFVIGEAQIAFHNAKGFVSSLHLQLEYREVPVALQAERLPDIRQALKAFAPWWY